MGKIDFTGKIMYRRESDLERESKVLFSPVRVTKTEKKGKEKSSVQYILIKRSSRKLNIIQSEGRQEVKTRGLNLVIISVLDGI